MSELETQGSGWELPKGAQPWSSFHWFRVGARESLSLVLLSERPTWYLGHYVEGRMVPCGGIPCELCGEGLGSQARFVFAVCEVTTRRVGLVEVSQSVAELFRMWEAEHGGLRGMWVELYKHSHSVRSRTECRCVREDPGHWWRSLEVPDPGVALELTWRKAGFKRSRSGSRVSARPSGSG